MQPPRLVLSWSSNGQPARPLAPNWVFHRTTVFETDEQGEFRVEDSGLPGALRVVTPVGVSDWTEKAPAQGLVLRVVKSPIDK